MKKTISLLFLLSPFFKMNSETLIVASKQDNFSYSKNENKSSLFFLNKNIIFPFQIKLKVLNGVKYSIINDNYPDLMVNFKLKRKLSKTEITKIESIFKKNKQIYVSDFSDNSIMLDFETSSEERLKSDMLFLENSVKEICNLIFSKKIDSIKVE